LVIAIDSDYLFPLEDSQSLAQLIPNAQLEVISSDFGHDGFLIEHTKITTTIDRFYAPQNNSNETVGLFGLGCVGQGFYQVLKRSKNLPQIKSVAIKHEFKARKQAFDKVTTNQHQLLNDAHINTIVETINNDEHAYRIAKSAVLSGKKFISASKKMIAHNLAEIIGWNKGGRQSILYEAAVAGSIPIIRNLDLYFEQSQNQSIKAIINGSSNYILTQMFLGNKSYDEALSEAQSKGFAETDPLADVGGNDAKYKAVILAVHAFGLVVHPDEVHNFGMQKIKQADVQWAKANNCTIKQVVSIKRKSQGLSIVIIPQLVKLDSELAKTTDENNIIILENNDTSFTFKGAGAGSIATGTAVLADLKASQDNYCYTYKIDNQLRLENDIKVKFWIKNQDYSVSMGGYLLQNETHCLIECYYNQLQTLTQKNIFVMRDF
jgi:homoserine dehydrogenase